MSEDRPPLLTVFAITVTGITVNSLITASVPDILLGLGEDLALAGRVIAAGTVPGVVMAPVIGVLADRYGRRSVILPSLVVFGLSGGLAALAPNLEVLLVLRFLQGAGSAGLINLAIVLIGDHWSGTERAALIGRNSAVLTVCLAIFPTLGGVLTDTFGWRSMFVVYLGAFATVVLVWWTMEGRGRIDDTTVGDQLRAIAPVLRRGDVIATLVATLVVFSIIFGAILTVLPLVATEEFGLSASRRGILLGVPAIAAFLVASNLGRLTAGLGQRRLLLAGAGIMTVGMAVLALAPSLTVLGVGVICYGLAEGALVPSLQDLASSAGPDGSRGALVAAQVGIARVGQTIGPVALTALAAGGGAELAFAVAGISAVVVLGPAAWLASTRGTVAAPA